MSQTITFRPTKELAQWIASAARKSGVSQGRFIRDHLAQARRQDNGSRRFMRLAGTIRGAPDLSTRKGFATK